MFLMRAGFFLLILAVLPLRAQPPEPAPPEVVFRTGTAYVRIDLQVLEKNRPVEGLKVSDLLLYDQGVPHAIENFGREAEPLQVLFVLDVSGSMGRILVQMAGVAQQSLGALRPEDEVGVMLYSRRSRLAQELTAERALAVVALRDAPEERDLGAGTSLNESLLAAADYFKSLPQFQGRRALIVLTDNGGLNEKTPDQAVLRALAESNIVLNAIVAPGARRPDPPPKGVEVNPDYTPSDVFLLAEQSGGEVLKADKPERLREMLEHIRLRYSLGYRAPAAEPGSWRTVKVEFTPEARRRYKKAELQHRPGYYAAP